MGRDNCTIYICMKARFNPSTYTHKLLFLSVLDLEINLLIWQCESSSLNGTKYSTSEHQRKVNLIPVQRSTTSLQDHEQNLFYKPLDAPAQMWERFTSSKHI